eukprot:TRINITY_DN34768_c1_g7_i3.p1 TRINITY_DN34768_c1_g7~~TRINITY_DN34768_c1_g7_i3.p1  ORF type:complete len:1075 (-),score=262.39 TRINITY_DN34768_c1_g7_i3:134-3358(-)
MLAPRLQGLPMQPSPPRARGATQVLPGPAAPPLNMQLAGSPLSLGASGSGGPSPHKRHSPPPLLPLGVSPSRGRPPQVSSAAPPGSLQPQPAVATPTHMSLSSPGAKLVPQPPGPPGPGPPQQSLRPRMGTTPSHTASPSSILGSTLSGGPAVGTGRARAATSGHHASGIVQQPLQFFGGNPAAAAASALPTAAFSDRGRQGHAAPPIGSATIALDRLPPPQMSPPPLPSPGAYAASPSPQQLSGFAAWGASAKASFTTSPAADGPAGGSVEMPRPSQQLQVSQPSPAAATFTVNSGLVGVVGSSSAGPPAGGAMPSLRPVRTGQLLLSPGCVVASEDGGLVGAGSDRGLNNNVGGGMGLQQPRSASREVPDDCAAGLLRPTQSSSQLRMLQQPTPSSSSTAPAAGHPGGYPRQPSPLAASAAAANAAAASASANAAAASAAAAVVAAATAAAAASAAVVVPGGLLDPGMVSNGLPGSHEHAAKAMAAAVQTAGLLAGSGLSDDLLAAQAAAPGAAPPPPPVQSMSLTKPPVELPEQLRNEFEVDHTPLGEGAFAVVRQLRHRQSGEVVALKVVEKYPLHIRNMLPQLKREVNIQGMLRHRHILKLLFCHEDDLYVYMILEHCAGGSLRSLCSRQPNYRLPDATAARYFAQICQGVAFMHQHSCVHRDLKPENMLLTAEDEVKICDFGWSAEVGSEQGLRTTCGTPHCWPPELFEGEAQDAGVDLWALGALAYELLVGHAPFWGSMEELRRKVLAVDLRYPPNLLSPEAINLFYCLLQRDPRTRVSASRLLADHPWVRAGLAQSSAEPSPSQSTVNAVLTASGQSAGGQERAAAVAVGTPLSTPPHPLPPPVAASADAGPGFLAKFSGDFAAQGSPNGGPVGEAGGSFGGGAMESLQAGHAAGGVSPVIAPLIRPAVVPGRRPDKALSAALPTSNGAVQALSAIPVSAASAAVPVSPTAQVSLETPHHDLQSPAAAAAAAAPTAANAACRAGDAGDAAERTLAAVAAVPTTAAAASIVAPISTRPRPGTLAAAAISAAVAPPLQDGLQTPGTPVRPLPVPAPAQLVVAGDFSAA